MDQEASERAMIKMSNYSQNENKITFILFDNQGVMPRIELGIPIDKLRMYSNPIAHEVHTNASTRYGFPFP